MLTEEHQKQWRPAVLKRKDLKPGMNVRNRVAGIVGEVRSDPDDPKKLREAHSDFVAVRARTRTTGEYHYPYWRIENCEPC